MEVVEEDEEYEERYLEVTSLTRGRRETAALSLSEGVSGLRDGFSGGSLDRAATEGFLRTFGETERVLEEAAAAASMSSSGISAVALLPFLDTPLPCRPPP